MVLRFFLSAAFMLIFACADAERDNIYDSKASNYIRKESFTDSRDNKTYKYVTIGNQTWMAENLDYAGVGTCYTSGYSNVSCSSSYGHLYKWIEAMALPDSCNTSTCASQIKDKHQGICPDGWHIPSSEEWNELVLYVGNSTALKATNGWNDYKGASGSGTDKYGFTALPRGGYTTGSTSSTSSSYSYRNSGTYGYWWTASESSATSPYYIYMSYSGESVNSGSGNKSNHRFSVRCVKD